MAGQATSPLWYRGASDVLLAKIQVWLKNYEKGVVSRTRPWLKPDGNTINLPMQYANKMIWKERELDYLIQVLTETGADAGLVSDIVRVRKNLVARSGMVAGNGYVVMMDFPKSDVQTMVDSLLKVKNMNSVTKSTEESLTEFVESRKGSDIGLWQS